MEMVYKVHSVVMEKVKRMASVNGKEMEVFVPVKSVQLVSVDGHGPLKVGYEPGKFDGKVGDEYMVTIKKK